MAKDESFPIGNAAREVVPTNPERTLKTTVEELVVITRQLRILSSLIALTTLVNIFWTFYITAPPDFLISERFLILLHALILLLCLLLLWQYDGLQKVGNALFEEISDVIQWQVVSERTTMALENTELDQKFFLQERTTLRQYTLTTNLPFLGRQGAIYYALFNIAIWLIVTLFAILTRFGP